MSAALDHLAARCSADPTFLAHALAAYQRRRNQSDESLAAELGTDAHGLTRLRLCGAPVGEPAKEAEEIRRIAETIGCDAVALARIVFV